MGFLGNIFGKSKSVDYPIVRLQGKHNLDLTITAIENLQGVLGFMCDDINRSIRLTSYMKNQLTDLFGKHNQTFKGEFLFYVWVLKYREEVIYVFTNNTKGTQFCIMGDFDNKKGKISIEFLSKMDSLLNVEK
jgi:hypothetical protein